MAWKERFAPTIRVSELVGYGPMKIDVEPEALGKGKFRVRATLRKGTEIQFTTFEGTIGNILEAQGKKGWAEPYFSEDVDGKGRPYTNWRPYKEPGGK